MKNVSAYIDLAFCLVVLPVMAAIFPVERWFHNFQWYVVAVGAWLYALYFLNRFVTVPMLFGSVKKRRLSMALIAMSVAVTFVMSKVSLYDPKPNVHDHGIVRVLPATQQYQQAAWSLFMIVEAYSFAVGLLTQANLQKARRRAVEAERDKAEINLYKAQIKPHFMFNTLNSLYGLFLTHDEKALESLERYISMLRHAHAAFRHDFVPIADEAEYIRQYVALQSLRVDDKTQVRLDIAIESASLTVPPMLLVTFVENCFKHGVSPTEQSLIKISLSETGGRLSFSTSNRDFSTSTGGERSGIANCRRRLSLVYPGKHQFSAQSRDGHFFVNLTINLQS